MSNIYSQEFLYYYKNQPNKKEIDPYDIEGREMNISCGDDLTVKIKLDDQKNIQEIGYTGDACAISEGAMSMLAEELKGKNLKYFEEFSEHDFLDFLGLELTPARVKCAVIGYRAIKNALRKIA